jgi:hypothetical protein
MRYPLIGITAAVAVIISPAWAQAPAPGAYRAQRPPAAYPDPYGYRFAAPTASDAYRQGLISRWELEQVEGPTPQALQGPSPNGERGSGPL